MADSHKTAPSTGTVAGDSTRQTAAADGKAGVAAWTGQEWKNALNAARIWLDHHSDGINALNVFPVPDGDTGTNMAMTMQSACKAVAESPSHSIGEIAAGMSYGALMGARGNSGVIFSQVLRGFSRGLDGHASCDGALFVTAMREAAKTAYQAVLKPVEGTMLTVIREMADGAEAALKERNDLFFILARMVQAGKESVARTPQLLDKLRDAGVVDAGGQGLFIIFEGVLRYVNGEPVDIAIAAGPKTELAPEGVHVGQGEYGYCTNFLLVGNDLDFPNVRARIAAMGDSVVVVGDERLIKVHIHTEQPGTVLNYVTSLGKLRQVSITDMQEQHDEFLEMHAQAADQIKAPPAPSGREEPLDTSHSAILAVVSGDGIRDVFKSMGATRLIEGGQTMNPSTEDILKAIEALPHTEVIVLPNNGNIVMAAKQAQGLTRKRVVVVPTDTIPQGIAALLAFNFDADIETNARAMERAALAVETGEITTAVRDAVVSGIKVNQGDVIGLRNGTLVVAGKNDEEVATALLPKLSAADREIITIYFGGDVTAAIAQDFAAKVQESYPDQAVEVVNGGQPFYSYIIAVE